MSSGNFPTFRTTGDRGIDEFLRRLEARLSALEARSTTASATATQQAANSTVPGVFVSVTTGGLSVTGVFAHSGTTVGFFGVAPATQPAAYTMTYSTGSRTNSAPTASAVSTTASTQTTPYGYATQAQADAIPVAINALIADVLNLKQVLTQVVKDLQGYGLLQ